MDSSRRDVVATVSNGEEDGVASSLSQGQNPPTQARVSASPAGDELASLKETRAVVQRMRLSMQRELEMARRLRAEAEKYVRETEVRARSQAQLIILQARAANSKEIAELKRVVNEEMQETLADIRRIKIAAQEELKAQKKLTNAAKIRALSLASEEKVDERSKTEEAVGELA